MQRWLIILIALIFLTNCASGDVVLTLDTEQKKILKGPLASLPQQNFKLGFFHDARPDTHRVGHKGENMVQTPDAFTTQPNINTIIQQTLGKVFQKNGQNIDPEGHLELSGTIHVFWLDVQPALLKAYFSGNVAIHLVIQDLNNELTIYEQDYTGHYHETSFMGFKKTWESVFNETLLHLAKQISLDQKLANALIQYDASAPKIVPLDLSL